MQRHTDGVLLPFFDRKFLSCFLGVRLARSQLWLFKRSIKYSFKDWLMIALIVWLLVLMQCFVLPRCCGSCSNWKISSSRLFTYLHFACYEASLGSHGEPVPRNSIRHSAARHSRTGLWVSTLVLFPCHWYAHIQITRPVLHSQGRTSISFSPWPHLMTSSLICKTFFFFFSH